jgi:hypothetical protein
MRVKLFTFRYSASLGGFEDSILQDFVRDKEVVAFREHFYTVNEVPHVTCVLTFQDAIVLGRAQGTIALPGARWDSTRRHGRTVRDRAHPIQYAARLALA